MATECEDVEERVSVKLVEVKGGTRAGKTDCLGVHCRVEAARGK